MQEVEKLLKELIKKIKDKDATYMFGVEYSSDTVPNYKAMIKFTKQGVQPFLAGATSEIKLIEEIKGALNDESFKDIAIRYCEGQIYIEEQAIKFHKDLISDYEKLEKENESTPT